LEACDLLALSLSKAISNRLLTKLENHVGSLEALWQLQDFELSRLIEKAGRSKKPFEGKSFLLRQAERVLAECFDLGISVVTRLDNDFPEQLKTISDPPPVLYFLGKLPKKVPMTAVVGTREADFETLDATKQLVSELVAAGHHIVSGLAFGVDASAHLACLEAGGQTTAVLAGGVENPYPFSHRKIYERILATGGCVLSEYRPGTEPLAFQFPLRNRIISGLCERVVMMQAAARSGALITTTYALEQNRDIWVYQSESMNPRYAGNQKLISDGASAFRTASSLLSQSSSLSIRGVDVSAKPFIPPIPEEVRDFASALSSKTPKEVREISESTRLSPEIVFSKLMKLMLSGHAKELPGARYMLVS
jgi:DNA processing protein